MKFRYSDKAPVHAVVRGDQTEMTFIPGEEYDLAPGEFPAFEKRGYLVALEPYPAEAPPLPIAPETMPALPAADAPAAAATVAVKPARASKADKSE